MQPTYTCLVEIPQGEYCNWDPDPKYPGIKREWCPFWSEDWHHKTVKWTDEQGRVHYKREGEISGFCRLHRDETSEELMLGRETGVKEGRPCKVKACKNMSRTDEYIVSTMRENP